MTAEDKAKSLNILNESKESQMRNGKRVVKLEKTTFDPDWPEKPAPQSEDHRLLRLV